MKKLLYWSPMIPLLGWFAILYFAVQPYECCVNPDRPKTSFIFVVAQVFGFLTITYELWKIV